jgi:hypothetical protein
LEELLAKDKEATLHGGIRRLAAKLKNGDSVVLDDCNPSQKSRASLISSLRKLVHEFELEGIEFRPKGGLTQCRVAAEFASAQEAEELEKDRLFLPFRVDSSDEEDSDSEDGDMDEEEGAKEGKKKPQGLEGLLASEHVQLDRKRQSTLAVRLSLSFLSA